MAALLSGLGSSLFAKCKSKPISVKYGAPPTNGVHERVKPQPEVIFAEPDSVPQDTIIPPAPDTLPPIPPEPEPPVCKYGPPSDWW